jgi:hypothetical protein
MQTTGKRRQFGATAGKTISWFASYLSPPIEEVLRNEVEKVKSQIKIVKRNQDNHPSEPVPQTESESGEQNIRKITRVVQSWIAELKERKSNEKQSFAPLAIQ